MDKKTDRYYYPAVFRYEAGEGISVDFPDLGVATSGANEADSLLSARELLGLTLYGLEEDGEPLPEPSPLPKVQCSKNEKLFSSMCICLR